LRIVRVATYIVRVGHHDRFGAQADSPERLNGSIYYFERTWREAYATATQTVLVRIDTDDGVHGWGEAQAPIAPEAVEAIIHELLAPMLIGRDPRSHAVLYDTMYRSMNVRGQTAGFMLDAIAGVDTALWDLHGKLVGASVAELLGGRFSDLLPAYVSGLRAPSVGERIELARRHLDAGFAAVKLFLGRGVREDSAEAGAVREGLGPDARILTDLFWVYPLPQAEHLGRVFEELEIEWVEAPMAPEDVAGHAELAAKLTLAVAVGEPLRTPTQFLPWLEQRALDVGQPDIARCGITSGRRIAELAAAFHRPVAFHLGVSLGISIAATWQLASATENFVIQEHEPPMLDISNEFLSPQLQVREGRLVVPRGPGLGVDVELQALRPYLAHERAVTARAV
jgi:galactonate dehydratase